MSELTEYEAFYWGHEQRVIYLQLDPDYHSLRLIDRGYVFVALELHPDCEQHRRWLESSRRMGAAWVVRPVAESAGTRTFRHGESLSLDLRFQNFLMDRERPVMHCTFPAMWGGQGLILHTTEYRGEHNPTVEQAFRPLGRLFTLHPYVEHVHAALRVSVLDLANDDFGGYIQDRDVAISLLGDQMPPMSLEPIIPGLTDMTLEDEDVEDEDEDEEPQGTALWGSPNDGSWGWNGDYPPHGGGHEARCEDESQPDQ